MRARKRIIATVTNDLSYDQRMIRICSTLVELGFEVCLVGRQRKNSRPLVDRPFQQKRLPCWFDKGKLFYLEYNIRLFFYLLFNRFDIVNAVDLDTILPAYLISNWKGKDCIYDAHEYFTEMPEVIRRPLVKKVWEWVADFTIPKVDACYTVGPELARIMGERYGVHFGVLRNVPFSQEVIKEQSPKGSLRLLYQGALNEGRGLEALIQAMEQLPNVQLWIAGEGDLSQQLRVDVDARGLASQVQFLGYLQPEELKKVTLQADIGLNLLEAKGLSYYYSLANKAFDYIQAGLPSIHMNFPEYQTINQSYKVFHLLENLKVETIVKGIQYFQNYPDFYEQLHQNCLKARKELNWEKEKAQLHTFYKG